MTRKQLIAIVPLSLLVCVLVWLTAYSGISFHNTYGKEADGWQLQSITQDIINGLLIAPSLLIVTVLLRGNSVRALYIWAGCLLYLMYTFLIYCFAIHFNALFAVYCAVLGLSLYLFISYFFLLRGQGLRLPARRLEKISGIYFISIAVLFGALWLSEVMQATLRHTVPANISENGLFTNPVQVIDLSILLPGVAIAGVLLLQGRKTGVVLAPVILTFFVLMDASLCILTLVQPLEAPSVPVLLFLLLLLVSAAGLLWTWLKK